MAIISIQNISKTYKIYPNPRDKLFDLLGFKSQSKSFSALNNVSFEINKGEFWGIIGKNGSGKSTLLKIITQHLQPTSGSISFTGRITYLQLGLGFDPELSGLENIKHSRMLQNLRVDHEEVIEFIKNFSELGEFINYPVKTYSSGMYSRLSFATAIAGDPDILIADEVLAVGDMSFAQKCLSKMREFKEKGKTVILVTHDVGSVKSFCDHAAWLNEGHLISIGDAKFVSEDYRNYMLYGSISKLSSPKELNDSSSITSIESECWINPNPDRRTISTGEVNLCGLRFIDATTSKSTGVLIHDEPMELQIKFTADKKLSIGSIGFTLHAPSGLIATHLNSNFFNGKSIDLNENQTYIGRFCFPTPRLLSGEYSLSCAIFSCDNQQIIEKYDHVSIIHIQDKGSPSEIDQSGYIIVPDANFQVDIK